jgi:hypothetical protein
MARCRLIKVLCLSIVLTVLMSGLSGVIAYGREWVMDDFEDALFKAKDDSWKWKVRYQEGALSFTEDTREPGVNKYALRVDYDPLAEPERVAWFGKFYDGYSQNVMGAKYLEFWMKGDGTSTDLGLILWITGLTHYYYQGEPIVIDSAEWTKITLDLNDFRNPTDDQQLPAFGIGRLIDRIQFNLPPVGKQGKSYIMIDDIRFLD